MSRFQKIFSRVLPVILLLAVAVPTHAATYTFTVSMNGTNEVPPNASPGTGSALIVYDNVAHTLSLNIVFSNLSTVGTGTTASHIHCCTAAPGTGTAGVATTTPTFAGFPLGVTSGTYINTLDLTLASSYNPAFVTANGGSIAASEAALIGGAFAGTDYLNIHSSFAPGGEIRGFLTQVPETSSASLVVVGIAALLSFAWIKRPSA